MVYVLAKLQNCLFVGSGVILSDGRHWEEDDLEMIMQSMNVRVMVVSSL